MVYIPSPLGSDVSLSEDPPGADKVVRPPGSQGVMDHAPVTGGGVDHRAASGSDPHMAADHYDIAGLDVGEIIDPGVTPHVPPAGRGYVALSDARLVQAPIYETGAVKGIGTFCSPHIGAA